jgi:hypothetical protein
MQCQIGQRQSFTDILALQERSTATFPHGVLSLFLSILLPSQYSEYWDFIPNRLCPYTSLLGIISQCLWTTLIVFLQNEAVYGPLPDIGSVANFPDTYKMKQCTGRCQISAVSPISHPFCSCQWCWSKAVFPRTQFLSCLCQNCGQTERKMRVFYVFNEFCVGPAFCTAVTVPCQLGHFCALRNNTIF